MSFVPRCDRTTEWFDTFFDALAFDVWAALVPPAHSDAEADYLLEQLHLRPGQRVLDAPSGDGRLALRMARRGVAVDAFDISPVATERLATIAADERLPISVTTADLRDPQDWPSHDVQGAYCAGNSFGYLDVAGTERFLRAVAARLPAGGRFVIDYPLVAESVLTRAEHSGSHVVGDVELRLDSRYDVRTSTYVADMVLRRGEEADRREVRHRVMTCAHVVDLVEASGFVVTDLHAGIDGAPFEVGSPGLWVTAIRRAEGD